MAGAVPGRSPRRCRRYPERVARLDQRHPSGVAGEWFADTRCIDCDVARHYAPGLIDEDDTGLSVVVRQPIGEGEELAMWRAALACPTMSIGTTSRRRAPAGVFPWELADGVSLCGYNAESSFGAHSYLVERPEGNVLVDSPRFHPTLVAAIDVRGGLDHILLSHRDDVADAHRFAERFGARVWIHEDDAAAAPYATDVVRGQGVVEVRPGLTIIPIPGHTRGSVAFHLEDRFLFTGDSLAWDRHRKGLDVFPGATWYSWEALAGSMASLVDVPFEWVLPGHGLWHEAGVGANRDEMAALVADMARYPRKGWRHRPAYVPVQLG